MPVPRRRRSKNRRDQQRTHKKLHASNVQRCDQCGAPKRPHRVCPKCGSYRGREYKTTVTT